MAPRRISSPRLWPQGSTPARRSSHQLRVTLTTARANTTSPTGMWPPSCFTQTPISEKLKALANMLRAA